MSIFPFMARFSRDKGHQSMISSFRNAVSRLHPTVLLLLSYLAAIAMGTAALMMPVSTVTGDISLIDALFTATSAICVTGLIVVDTGSYFSVFGQWVLLFLIQIGGIGIMTISVALFQIIGKKVFFQQRMAMQEIFTHTPRKDIYALVRSVLVFTLSAEIVGAVILFFFWSTEYSISRAAFCAVFHSVSAFCNAGFSLFKTSFMGARSSVPFNLTIITLIILGGIGFPVVYELYFRSKRGIKRQRMSVQTKTVLITTVLLILAGTAVLLASQREMVQSSGFMRAALAALFQSVTCRTAGFNTIDIASLNTATLAFMMFLMLVGASPGSCGGGIKTTTLSVLAAFSWSRLQRYRHVNLFQRTIPHETVSKSMSVMVLSVTAICTVTFLILFFDPEHGSRIGGNRQFLSYLFEAVSAFGTVGLSMGVTSVLAPSGKALIMALMIIGRVGVPAFAYIIAGAEPARGIQYAEENIMIG
jgi:trk system potassium uptake protein TrkH